MLGALQSDVSADEEEICMSSLTLVKRRLMCVAVPALLVACATPAPPPPPPPPPYKGPVLQIAQIDRGVQIVLPSTVLFEVGKSSFNSSEADAFLDRVAKLLTTKTDKRVSVEGHTDSDGSAALNDTLSKARAKAVSDALASRGVDAARMDSAGFSFNRPAASNSTEDGKRLNRRVELIVLDEKVEKLTAGEHPGSFEAAWSKLKDMIDKGLIKPVEGGAR
ncbi:MAG: OmpA family protein [Ideonella sp. MAG2]|nr:MAG: OmpA family protein [Ideonella sp. MAG2]